MASSSNVRHFDDVRSKDLRPGDDHYRAYVGPPDQYDFMGATQFRLLCALGLREHHSVLDFGCGSLRAGRLLIQYLSPTKYCGLEPNKWLIEDAIERQLGRELITLKQPTFRNDDDFKADGFGKAFDFIVAQSIFAHTGSDLIAITLESFRRCLNPDGLILATFIDESAEGGAVDFTGSGWVYPGCVTFRSATILRLVSEAGLFGTPLPWFHPRQTWYALALDRKQLPSSRDSAHLSGAVLRDSSLRQSVRPLISGDDGTLTMPLRRGSALKGLISRLARRLRQ